MRKSRFILLAILLFVGNISFVSSAQGAAKLGSACKMSGLTASQGQTALLCVRVKGKLIWTKKPVSNVIQTPLGSPIALKAYAELQKAIDSMGSEQSPKITTIPTPGASSKLVRDIQKNLIFSSNYFSNYLPPSYPITSWVIGSPEDLKWYSASWRVAIPWQAENLIARQDGFSAQVGMTTDGSFAMIITSPDQLTTFHEFTHTVQDYLASGKAGLPCWVREGMAEYESNAMMGRNSEIAYKNAMLNLVSELSMINFSLFKYRSAGLDYWVNFFVNDETRNNGECRLKSSALDPAYSVGGLGFQYLNGQYGRDKVFEFIKSIGQDWKGVCASPNEKMIPCKSWKTSFKKSFGVEPATAYKAMGAFIVNQIEWAAEAKGVPESTIQNEYPQSRKIPDYPILPARITAGVPCDKKDEANGQLTCIAKDNFLFWAAGGNTSSQNNSGSQNNSNPQPMIDDLGAPAGVPAPGRTCPNIGDRARYEKTPLICVKNSNSGGLWMIDPNPPA